jgi:glutamine amidotransferase
MIAIVDYGMGNIQSLSNAIRYIGSDVIITAEEKELQKADRIILPGVGAFGDAMASIRNRGLDKILFEQIIIRKKPILGICLGLQLFGKSSEEHGYHEGLGWLDARIVAFNIKTKVHIPHIGWNDITFSHPDPLFSGLKEGEKDFYFVHSYYMECNNPLDVYATCNYGVKFVAAIKKDNILGTQFHPEKSQDNGIHVLRNFLAWTPGKNA